MWVAKGRNIHHRCADIKHVFSLKNIPANDHIHWLKLRPWLHIRDLVYGHKRCVSGVSSQLWRSLHQPQGASFSIDTSTRPSWIMHGTLTESKTLSLSEQTRFVLCKLNISTQFTEIFEYRLLQAHSCSEIVCGVRKGQDGEGLVPYISIRLKGSTCS